jgi:hypothetical protein
MQAQQQHQQQQPHRDEADDLAVRRRHELHALLDAQLHFGPEYGWHGLSNHLPMALHALWALGADGTRLRLCFDRYRAEHKLPAAAPAGRVLDEWPAVRGDLGRYVDLRVTFEDQLVRHGMAVVLQRAMPLLWPGALGAAFHGLIRTAHAVQAGHTGEIAAGLAYWAARWLPVPTPAACHPAASLADWTASLEAAAQRVRPAGSLISERAVDATQTPAYVELAASAPLLDGWSALADWAAGLYARSGNFTILHVVTGIRAARVMAPWAGEPDAACSTFLRAAVAGVLASHLVVDQSPALPLGFDWSTARAGAIASDDEHLIKLIHALDEMRELDGAAADEAQRLAAAARVLGIG